ncbi:MAG: glycoside hydrolase family 1 protein [Thermoprotei archaeon]|nr:MAG: glycoside hydrolase family 1 protein [Thermoprotei archaeon]
MKIPKEFMLGASLSSFQFEGGFRGDEDPNNDWWIWVHDWENIIAGIVSGDFPENGPGYWRLFRQDHDLAEKLGMNTLRVGIEWSRIFPRPTFDVKVTVDKDEDGNILHVDIDEKALAKLDEIADQDAVKHYIEMYSDWKNRGKQLIINLYHWPLPLWIHDPIKVRKYGPDRAPSGWLDEKTIIEFVKYAAYVSWKLRDLADMWSTMNEPNVVYEQGYMFIKNGFPPGYLSFEAAEKAKKNLIYAHARAYEVVKKITGKPVGIIYALPYIESLNGEKETLEAIKSYRIYEFLDLIIKGKSVRNPILRKELASRADWLGVNYYSRIVFKFIHGKPIVLQGYGFFCSSSGVSKMGLPCSDFGWEIYPQGLYLLLKEIHTRYNGLPIIVTENGISDKADKLRPKYLVSHLYNTLKARNEGVPVKGYLHWSLIDNYEWAQGFRQRFGLVIVDFNTKKRYIRPSALVFREIALSQEIPEELMHLTHVEPLI